MKAGRCGGKRVGRGFSRRTSQGKGMAMEKKAAPPPRGNFIPFIVGPRCGRSGPVWMGSSSAETNRKSEGLVELSGEG